MDPSAIKVRSIQEIVYFHKVFISLDHIMWLGRTSNHLLHCSDLVTSLILLNTHQTQSNEWITSPRSLTYSFFAWFTLLCNCVISLGFKFNNAMKHLLKLWSPGSKIRVDLFSLSAIKWKLQNLLYYGYRKTEFLLKLHNYILWSAHFTHIYQIEEEVNEKQSPRGHMCTVDYNIVC